MARSIVHPGNGRQGYSTAHSNSKDSSKVGQVTGNPRHFKDPLKVEQLAALFLDISPKLELPAQRVALQTYRALAEGEAVSVARISGAAEVAPQVARELLEAWPGVVWEEGRVIGFWGLSPRPVSRHRLRVEDRTLFAWCAWDTLFLPELIGKPALVESSLKDAGQSVTLSVSADGLKNVNPSAAVMSMVMPHKDMMRDIVSSFCQFINFFPSREQAEKWVGEHGEASVMGIEEGFRLGALKNRGQFPDLL